MKIAKENEFRIPNFMGPSARSLMDIKYIDVRSLLKWDRFEKEI
jgi:hypothetical protein